jgi:uncharacterized lipoprotein YddW (UPF0748 family)
VSIASVIPRHVAAIAVLLAAAGVIAESRGAAVPAAAAAEVRALWVTRTTLASPEAIARMVDAARKGGFNTLLVQVRGRGDAYYGSPLEPRAAELARQPAAFDPLAETLTRAHAAGLAVHAWINVNLVAGAVTRPTAAEHVLVRHPEWLMVPRELAGALRTVDPRAAGYVARVAQWTRARSDEIEGLYVSPIHQGAAEHAAAITADLATRYALDGIHVDYVRFPGEQFDYSAGALRAYREWLDGTLTPDERRTLASREPRAPFAAADLFPDRWAAFRRSRLTGLVMRIRTAVKAARPGIVLSAAIRPEVELATDQKLQDWRTWVDQGLVDVICPMAYATDPATFARDVAAVRDLAGDRPVWAGIGAWRLTRAQTLRHLASARALGVRGTILFSYEALVTPPNTAASLAALGRAAFGGH